MAALLNQIFPDEPISLEQLEHHERTYPAGNPRLRLVAETEDGQVVGYGECERPYMTAQPDFFGVFVAVDAAWQHRGIGQALLAAVTPFAEEHGFRKLHCGCRENSADSVRFLEQAGFRQIGIRFESALDLRSFDETPFLAKVERVKAAGYEVITLAEARSRTPRPTCGCTMCLRPRWWTCPSLAACGPSPITRPSAPGRWMLPTPRRRASSSPSTRDAWWP